MTISGVEAQRLNPGSVVRWDRDRTDGGLRCLTPQMGVPVWVPPIAANSRYEVIFCAPAMPAGYRPPALPVRLPPLPGPCDCEVCQARRPEPVSGVHVYSVETDAVSPVLADEWRWRCACSPRAMGRWQSQSPNAAFHSWLDHVARAGRRTT